MTHKIHKASWTSSLCRSSFSFARSGAYVNYLRWAADAGRARHPEEIGPSHLFWVSTLLRCHDARVVAPEGKREARDGIQEPFRDGDAEPHGERP